MMNDMTDMIMHTIHSLNIDIIPNMTANNNIATDHLNIVTILFSDMAVLFYQL